MLPLAGSGLRLSAFSKGVCLSLGFFAVLWLCGCETGCDLFAGMLGVIISSVVIGSGKFSVL